MLSLTYAGALNNRSTDPVSPDDLFPHQVYGLIETYAGAVSSSLPPKRVTGRGIHKMINRGEIHALRRYEVVDSEQGPKRLLKHLPGLVQRIIQ